ncbi:hypothetical protein MAPG_08645 [Magnaporthiopsis poae ATCC 64411]|uniref:Uncharacterized protein n=1 Tax=Magnaporthiopsis poae (strain ATCC 64411 / 73-15) TaxID=644358 RepID=A0A0C4E7W7_MAGP6|nr:hypothetical protein MAPG_08645 [Magnaporthiopsis poae ATCC 64411]
MFRIRVCSSCSIRVRIAFGTKCSDCEARQRAREREEENARLRRRVHFDDEPVIIHRSPSPCRLRIRRSSPRNNHDDNDRSVVRMTTTCTTNDDDDIPSIVDDDDDDDDGFRRHGTPNTRHDRFGGHEYDREVNWEIRRDRPSRRRDRNTFDLFCEF